ncbi:MAG: hypothetical protein GY715_17010 [Planctomycetes bacterium]|nr:hypothetical protein [Planctomycetota bacterium]
MRNANGGTNEAKTEPPGVCPYVNHNDLRCATRFSLGRIEQAFSVCFGAYYGCPMFHRINGERTRSPEPAVVPLTISSGTGHGTGLPLRPTGT